MMAVDRAHAGMIIEFTQVGPDVVGTIGGTFIDVGGGSPNLQGAYASVYGGDPGSNGVNYFGATSSGNIGVNYNHNYYFGTRSSGPSGGFYWGSTTISAAINASSSSLSFGGLEISGGSSDLSSPNYVAISADYAFGSQMVGSLTFTNKTMAELGLTNYGDFVYTFTGISGSDTLTVRLNDPNAATVPEPSSLLFASVTAYFGLRRYCRKGMRSAAPMPVP